MLSRTKTKHEMNLKMTDCHALLSDKHTHIHTHALTQAVCWHERATHVNHIY